MSMAVIEVLEFIEIDVKDRAWAALGLPTLQDTVKCMPVAEPGQQIRTRHHSELALSGGSFRYIAHSSPITTEPALPVSDRICADFDIAQLVLDFQARFYVAKGLIPADGLAELKAISGPVG